MFILLLISCIIFDNTECKSSKKTITPNVRDLFYVRNPIESKFPSHWIPEEFLKKIVESRLNTPTQWTIVPHHLYENKNKKIHKANYSKKEKEYSEEIIKGINGDFEVSTAHLNKTRGLQKLKFYLDKNASIIYDNKDKKNQKAKFSPKIHKYFEDMTKSVTKSIKKSTGHLNKKTDEFQKQKVTFHFDDDIFNNTHKTTKPIKSKVDKFLDLLKQEFTNYTLNGKVHKLVITTISSLIFSALPKSSIAISPIKVSNTSDNLNDTNNQLSEERTTESANEINTNITSRPKNEENTVKHKLQTTNIENVTKSEKPSTIQKMEAVKTTANITKGKLQEIDNNTLGTQTMPGIITEKLISLEPHKLMTTTLEKVIKLEKPSTIEKNEATKMTTNLTIEKLHKIDTKIWPTLTVSRIIKEILTTVEPHKPMTTTLANVTKSEKPSTIQKKESEKLQNTDTKPTQTVSSTLTEKFTSGTNTLIMLLNNSTPLTKEDTTSMKNIITTIMELNTAEMSTTATKKLTTASEKRTTISIEPIKSTIKSTPYVTTKKMTEINPITPFLLTTTAADPFY